MDPVSFGFLLWVVILGGGIAYLADRLGRHLGKNRLRLFGMRPRHTAEVLTLTAGALIPVFTIIILTVASQDVRTWLIEGRQAIQKAKNYRDEIAVQDTKLKDMRTQVADAERRLSEMKGLVAKAEADQKNAASDAAVQKQIAVAARKQAVTLAGSVRTAQGQLVAARNQLGATRKNLDETKTSFLTIQGSYSKLLDQTRQSYEKIAELQEDTAKFEKQRDDAEGQVTVVKKQLEDKLTELTNLTETFNKEKERLTQDLEEIRVDLEEKQNQLTYTKSQLDTALIISMTQPLIFHMGEELTRLPVRQAMNHLEAEAALRSLFGTARAVASARGAKPNAMGVEAGLFPMLFENSSEEISVEKQIQEILEKLKSRDQEAVIIARARFNSFQEGFVPLALEIRDNPLIYKQGELLAEERIDGTLPNDQVLARISEFLTVRVKAKVESDQLIPVIGRENSFAEVPPEEVINIVNRIRGFNRTVRLQVLAKEDTRASGPLKIEFRIR